MSYMYNFNAPADDPDSIPSPLKDGLQRFASDRTSIPQEIDLYDSIKELDALESQADLYAIILATEHLERNFARDSISHKEYTTECLKLLSQFKLAERAALQAGNIASTE